MTSEFIDTLTQAARDEINAEIAYVEGEIVKVVKKLNTKATIALGESLHDRIVDHYAPLIADAMRDGVSDADLLAAVNAAAKKRTKVKKAKGDDEEETTTSDPGIGGPKPEMTPITSDIALGAIASNVNLNQEILESVLSDLYGDAGLAGAGVGAQQIGDIPADNAFATIIPGIKWASWHPGDLDAAQYVANGRLKEILDDLDITIRGINDAAMDRMSTVLANGLNEGLAPKTIAANMKDVIADPKRAEVIARTETARAQVSSAVDIYLQNGTEMVRWHSNMGACAACIALDEGSPYPIDDIPMFPHHPNDRCQILPEINA